MFQLAIALCHFAGPATTELTCTTIRTTTDDCVVALEILKEQYDNTEKFIKMAMCTKKIKHTKIQSAQPNQQFGSWGFGT